MGGPATRIQVQAYILISLLPALGCEVLNVTTLSTWRKFASDTPGLSIPWPLISKEGVAWLVGLKTELGMLSAAPSSLEASCLQEAPILCPGCDELGGKPAVRGEFIFVWTHIRVSFSSLVFINIKADVWHLYLFPDLGKEEPVTTRTP